ncbi:hypothetical protein WN51_13396 [Melipona quadrifasciata]|uniref:Uncharacterized protein n=1 Tax=Melipona quadrifasciata TaxID=166423 RepID=A0A0M9A3G8_9HYME|nr:hypothetical protein WN51_13396 [Melipona quadrifasciata]
MLEHPKDCVSDVKFSRRRRGRSPVCGHCVENRYSRAYTSKATSSSLHQKLIKSGCADLTLILRTRCSERGIAELSREEKFYSVLKDEDASNSSANSQMCGTAETNTLIEESNGGVWAGLGGGRVRQSTVFSGQGDHR